MKAFLFAGAFLMAGAGVYGFVDYREASHDQSFKNLYETEKAPPAKIVEGGKPVTREVAGSGLLEVAKRTIPSVIATEVKNPEELLNTGLEEQEIPNSSNVRSTSKRSVKNKKELNYKLFSRARIEEPIPAPAKTAGSKLKKN